MHIMKRVTCLFVLLACLISAVPAYGAEVDYGTLEGGGSDLRQARAATASASVSMADGAHEKWIDRVAGLPQYAIDLYNWLDENANPDGALADPTKGELYKDKYYYRAAVLSGTTTAECSADNYKTVAQQATQTAMYNDYKEAKEYLSIVFDAFDRDHPEIFWLSNSTYYSYNGSYSCQYIQGEVVVDYDVNIMFCLKTSDFDIRYSDYQDPETIARDTNKRDTLVQSIIQNCPKTNTEDQIRYLNQVLTERNAYNSLVANNTTASVNRAAWECLSALEGRAGTEGPVCEGYAKAFMVLCRELDIPCVLVDGKAKPDPIQIAGAHMWNYVCVNNTWYAVDITWNDPFVSQCPAEVKSGSETDEWLFMFEDTVIEPGMTFIESHVVENQPRRNGFQFLNGPMLGTTPVIQTSTISGTVTSFAPSNDKVTFELYSNADNTLVATHTSASGKGIPFTLNDVKHDEYILKVSAPGHATRTYAINVNADVSLDVKICLMGDVSGDGRINIADVAKIYSHIKQTNLLTDAYQLQCADVSGDGKINIADTAKVYAYVKSAQ